MPELTLYDQERDPLAGHLDSVGVPELVGCEPTPDSGGQRGPMQLGTDPGRRAWPPAGRAAQNAEERADRQGPAQLEPRVELLPRPAVHPDLPPATTLSSTDQDGPPLAVKIGLSQRQRLADPQPGTPEHDDQSAQPHRLRSVPRGSHHVDDLLHGWRVRRIAKTLVARHAALVKAGQGRLRPAAPGTIQQSYRFHDVLL